MLTDDDDRVCPVRGTSEPPEGIVSRVRPWKPEHPFLILPECRGSVVAQAIVDRTWKPERGGPGDTGALGRVRQVEQSGVPTQPSRADTIDTEAGYAFFNVHGYLGTVTPEGDVVTDDQFVEDE